MSEYLRQVNASVFYLIVGAILLFVVIFCIVLMVKSYRAGIAMGMDKEVLKRAVTSSATFTVLPSISILLGVIALSGSLGVPLSWLRLSVVGALQYELNVAEISATSIGLSGLKVSEMSVQAFVTVALVMTVGILGGVTMSIFGLKKYTRKISGGAKKKDEPGTKKKKGFGDYATIAMFIGLCSAYIASYIGTFVVYKNYMPLFVAGVSAVTMAVFEYFTVKRHMDWLDNFSVAASMLAGMVAAVLLQLAV